jgi:hypothetical protein
MRSAFVPIAAAALLLGGCSYTYSNPAEKLNAGEATGRVVADLSATGTLQPVAGVTVTLKGSMNALATRDNGRFFMLGLPAGRHTLLFDKGTTWALQRDLEIAFGSDGQLEGVILGDLQLRYAVGIGGFISPPTGVSIDSNPVLTNTPPANVPPVAFAFDEATGATAVVTAEQDLLGNYTGRFRYAFPPGPVGPHRIRFAITAAQFNLLQTWVGGPITQNVPDTSEGQSITLSDAPLRPPSAALGKLRFKVVRAPGAPLPAIEVANTAVTPYTPISPAPVPDSTGAVELDLAEGRYSVFLNLGASPGTWETPASQDAVVIGGQTTELGSIYVVDGAKVSAGQNACLEAADCPAGAACVNGQCKVPDCIAGVFPECSNWQPACFTTGGTTTPCASGAGICASGPLGDVCIPKTALACVTAGEPIPVQKPQCIP